MRVKVTQCVTLLVVMMTRKKAKAKAKARLSVNHVSFLSGRPPDELIGANSDSGTHRKSIPCPLAINKMMRTILTVHLPLSRGIL